MAASSEPTTNDMPMATATSPPKIGVITCSQRSLRIGDQISNLVYNTLKSYQQSTHSKSPASKQYELSLIDLADHPLPFFDEPIIPQQITDPTGYHHEHTRAWSRFISSHSAFVFVTPQYNWSFPANLKNAIDYLFNEWVGKPATVVSYGGHGGGRGAEQLKQVLRAVKMDVADKTVALSFPGHGFLKLAAKGKDLGLGGGKEDENGELWAKEMREVQEVFGELVEKL